MTNQFVCEDGKITKKCKQKSNRSFEIDDQRNEFDEIDALITFICSKKYFCSTHNSWSLSYKMKV